MSHKSNLQSFQCIKAADMTSNVTSAVTNTQWLDNIGYQANVTGSPTGTLSVQISADYAIDNNGNVINAGTWITLVSQQITAGSPASLFFDLVPTSAPFMRLFYSAASGSGTLNAFITGKSV